MNYHKIYGSIVLRAKSQNREKLDRSNDNFIYYERHHIIPRCLKGNNSKDNLVLLTAKEHFICHKLLVEIYPDNKKVRYAFIAMYLCNKYQDRSYKISSREYERLKTIKSELLLQYWEDSDNRNKIIKSFREYWDIDKNREENGKRTKKSFSNKTTKEKHKRSQNKRWESKESHISHSESLREYFRIPGAREKNSSIQKEYWKDKKKPNEGKSFPEEWKEKLSLSAKKRFDNPDEIRKMSERVRNRPMMTCPHCNYSSNNMVMYRYHFDNCKHKKVEVLV